MCYDSRQKLNMVPVTRTKLIKKKENEEVNDIAHNLDKKKREGSRDDVWGMKEKQALCT